MPSRLIHYLIAEKINEQIEIADRNRFVLGSLCPDMSSREDGSKNRTHYSEVHGAVKGGNWLTYVEQYKDKMEHDDLYLGILCHLITDSVWFHEIMDREIRSKSITKEERTEKYLLGYTDFHKLNYILIREFGLTYNFVEDHNIDFEGIHQEMYDDVVGGLYNDFFDEPESYKDDLKIYRYEITVPCIELCIKECMEAINAFRSGTELPTPEKYYVGM